MSYIVLHKELIEKIQYEINEIEELFESYSVLIELIKSKEPDLIETTAMATVLHSFYNGIEKIFVLIAKEKDRCIPNGFKWHSDLLSQMVEDNALRSNVISKNTLEILNEYMAFRHFYRHAYSFHLRWDKIKCLCLNLEKNWNTIRCEIEGFVCSNGE